MAFVYKRNKIYYVGWREWAVNGKGEKLRIQKSKPISPDKQAAEEVCARMTLNSYADKNKTIKKKILLQEFYDEYVDKYSSRKKREKTIFRDKLIFDTFKKLCPHIIYAENFDDDALNQYIKKRLEKGVRVIRVKASSINRELGMLKNLSKWGYRNRYLSHNYYDLVEDLPENDSEKRKPFNIEEIQKIIENTTYPQKEAHIFSIWHGMRAGEICALECCDFMWKEENTNIKVDYIKIRNKPHLAKFVKTKLSERDIPIHPFWREELRLKWLEVNSKGNNPSFFLITRENKPLSPSGLSAYTFKIFKKLGINKCFHCGRHTFATFAKDGGAEFLKTSKNLGHSNLATTRDVYTEFKDHEHFDIINFININIQK